MKIMRTLETVQVPGINIRLAEKTLFEIDRIAILEQAVWGDNGADANKIESRLIVFPEGSYVAEDIKTKKIVGYVCFQQVADLRKQDSLSWSSITDDGLTTRSHQPDGEYLYGISLSVHYSMNGKKLSNALGAQTYLYMLANKKKGFFVGSRIPMFKGYRKEHPDTTAEEYVKLRKENGDLYDYELRLYHKISFVPTVAKVLPDFFPDEDSLNYGALLFDENIFFDLDEEKTKQVMQMVINQDFQSLKNLKL